MEKQGTRAQRAARLRQEARAAALALFEARGYGAFTMEEVAAAAQVSPRTLYRMFGTKEALLLQEHGEAVGAFTAALEARGVRQACLDMARAFDREAERWRRVLAVVAGEDVLRGRVGLLDQGFVESLVPHLGRGRKARLRAEALFGAIQGAWRLWLGDPRSRLERLVAEALDLMAPVLGATGEAPAPAPAAGRPTDEGSGKSGAAPDPRP